jgi:hypothetical protein
MRRRTLSTTLAISICLLTAQAAFADSVDFQTAVGSGGATSGGTQTAQSGSGATSQSGGTASQSGGSTSQSGSTGSQVQTVDLGDVTGTVCDCGEIAPAEGNGPASAGKGGFPKFPLFALAVLPIACPVVFCHDTPPPRPPNPPVPEPLTLATFAAGLAALAGLRSRRGK